MPDTFCHFYLIKNNSNYLYQIDLNVSSPTRYMKNNSNYLYQIDLNVSLPTRYMKC